MGQYQKQHYVPKLLQRFFSDDGCNIGVYILARNKATLSSIRTTAQDDWLYKFSDEEKTELEHWLGEVEDSITPVLRRLNDDKAYLVSPEEYDACMGFIIVQLMRTPKATNAMKYIYDFCMRRAIPIFMEEVHKGVRTNTNIPFQSVISVSSVIDNWPCDKMIILRNESEVELIMSDSPACLFSPISYHASTVGLEDLIIKQPAFSACMLYMPISPTCGFLMYDDRYYQFTCKDVMNLTTEDVHVLNSLEIANASKILLFRSFDKDAYPNAFSLRDSELSIQLKDSIYAPVDYSFRLSALECDKGVWSYLINKLAFENPDKLTPKIEGLM